MVCENISVSLSFAISNYYGMSSIGVGMISELTATISRNTLSLFTRGSSDRILGIDMNHLEEVLISIIAVTVTIFILDLLFLLHLLGVI